MADSPLASAAPAVDPVTNPMGALQVMSSRVQKGQDYLDQQRSAYDQQMSKLTEMLNAPASTEAAEWGAIAKGAASVAPTWQNFGQMLAASGASYGEQQEAARRQNVVQQEYLTKLQEDRLKGLEKSQQQLALGAKGTQGFEFRQNSDKTTTVFSKAMGVPVGTYGPQDIGKISSMAQTLAKAAFEKGDYDNLDDALAWATGKAMETIGGMEKSKGNRTAPLAGDVGGLPTTQPPGAAISTAAASPETEKANASVDQMFDTMREKGTRVGIDEDVYSRMSRDDKELADRLGKRITANPKATELDQQRLDALMSKYQTVAPATSGAPPTTPMSKKDVVRQEYEKSGAGATGKDLAKEASDLNASSVQSGKLINQLSALQQLYQNPNMPQGERGATLQSIRSTLKTLGIDTEDVGEGDLADKISKNFSLHLRTAEGQNLLPGAMSNYEDKLLQSMGPGLSSTQAGRMAQIEMMLESAKSNQRIAEEVNKHMDKNGVVSPDWRARRLRIEKEEMARLAVKQRDVIARMKGVQ